MGRRGALFDDKFVYVNMVCFDVGYFELDYEAQRGHYCDYYYEKQCLY